MPGGVWRRVAAAGAQTEGRFLAPENRPCPESPFFAPMHAHAPRPAPGATQWKGEGMTDEGTIYLNTREAAIHLGLSTRTLDRYRVSGDGPVFLRFGGRVRYLREDLDAWARSRRRKSTSDDGTGERPALPAPDSPGPRSGKTGRARGRAKTPGSKGARPGLRAGGADDPAAGPAQ